MKTVLITGGSRGIGAAAVRRFAAAGYGVGFTYLRSEERAQQLVRQTGAFAIRADASSSSETDRAATAFLGRFHHLDVLINNAGISSHGLLMDASDEDYRRIMDVNLFGTFCAMRAVLPHMIGRRSGCIINVASIWGEEGAANEALYSASKAAVIGLTRSAAKELASAGIRVNCVSPGAIDTEMNGNLDAAELRALCRRIPLGRMGRPEEVVEAMFFLASGAARSISGQILPVGGGLTD